MKPLPKMAPHTAAKHLLLRRYLDRWFPILGQRNPTLNYIDGFAGPGEYLDGEPGSPIHAIEAAQAHVQRGTLAPNVSINFRFVEADPDYALHLESRLNAMSLPPSFECCVLKGEFANVVGDILTVIEKKGAILAPTFAFVDPFGFSGIPFELTRRILSKPKCEVFVNIMVEFINRFLQHPNESIVAHIPTTFGTLKVFEIANAPGQNRIGALLNLYRQQLEGAAKHVGRFDMHGRKNQKEYSLFFASNAPRGFEKMKEAMWSVDVAEGGKFSDFQPGAAAAPGMFVNAAVWEDMQKKFRGRRVRMSEVEKFVIEHTDYLPKHARAALKEREDSDEIKVEVAPGQRRRKGQFPVDKVSIVFPS